jgi:hypothetical protein
MAQQVEQETNSLESIKAEDASKLSCSTCGIVALSRISSAKLERSKIAIDNTIPFIENRNGKQLRVGFPLANIVDAKT